MLVPVRGPGFGVVEDGIMAEEVGLVFGFVDGFVDVDAVGLGFGVLGLCFAAELNLTSTSASASVLALTCVLSM